MTASFLILLAGLADLGDRVDALVRGAKLGRAEIGIRIVDLDAGAVVHERDAGTPLRLASNTKLLTTAAVLDRLGPGFTFRTVVGTAGDDLHVFAGGDPNISGRFHDGDPTAVFRRWTARLRAAGIDRVGDVVLHTGIFDDVRVHPAWERYDRWRWYVAPFGALSLNDNCVDLTVDRGTPGEPCRVSLSPDTRHVQVVNRTTSAVKPTKPWGFTRPEGSNRIRLTGQVGGKATYSVAIHDPAAFFGAVLRETLARGGVAVDGEVKVTDAPRSRVSGLVERADWRSGLVPTLQVCNARSQNFYAEMLLRVLGWQVHGRGTTETGVREVAAFLEEIGCTGVRQADGSGLSPDNFASAGDLATLLAHMDRHEHAAVFRGSLAVNGAREGTLRRRMRDADLRGRIRAKTGHIRGVSTLSGYADAIDGTRYAFSILVNTSGGTYAADRLQDAVCALLIRGR